jgi:hypothetical protein
VASASAIIAAANLADDASIDAIDAVRFTSAGTAAAQQLLAVGAAGDVLWAATWVYASGGTDPAPLMPLLSSDDPSVKAMAAAGAAAFGRVEGLDALAQMLPVDVEIKGSEPPLAVSTFAAATLARFTGQALDRTASQADWLSWLQANRDQLIFDPEERTWALP